MRGNLIVLSLIILTQSAVPGTAQNAAVHVAGLSDTVEIIRDRWGISHIYAKNEADLFFAQGFSAARDRLFQLEIWRREATGTTAEILGKRALKRDTGARLFKFRGEMKQELNHYHPHGSAIIQAFVDGINAFIAETERDPSLLPMEFRLLDIRPGKWNPSVVISRHQGLLANAVLELNLGRAVAMLGPDKVRELLWLRPGKPELALDPAINGALLAANILELYSAYRESVAFGPEDVLPEFRGERSSSSSLAGTLPDEFDLLSLNADLGSNNWAIGGQMTLTGHPLLANDPHRVLQVPSLRYWVHLVAPGWNVIGGGEPGIPGVSIGHNEFGAWGITINGQDSEDIYVYETNPSDPLQYRYKGAWEAMRVIEETIPVKNEAPAKVTCKYTRHGPVLFENAQSHTAYALRAGWLEPGCAPYLASLRMDQARNWGEFREACGYSRIPSLNMVWADVAGNIGYQSAAISPIRRNFSGLVPVPGDGRYEWNGYLPISDLPHALTPSKGYIATANNYQVPDGYSYPEALHYLWGDEMRAVRIDEVLRSGRMQTVADLMRLQHDEVSIPARSLVTLLRGLTLSDAAAEKARSQLLSWDFALDRDSIAAGIYVAWERYLTENLRDLLVPAEARTAIGPLNLKRVIDWIVAPDGRFGADPIAGRDDLLSRSLAQAVSNLSARLGPDMNRWKYGQENYKHVLIRHPLSPAVNAATRQRMDAGPQPRGGYASTVNATGSSNNQTTGASFRIIADLENWDNSVGSNTPGQSGNPESPHYRDLFDLWAKGKYFPVFFSRTKVESVAEEHLQLVPAGHRLGPGQSVVQFGNRLNYKP
jgi:penicillin amidase